MPQPDRQALFEAFLVASEAVIAARVGPSGEIRWANRRLAALLGRTPIGIDARTLVAAPHQARLAALLDHADGGWQRLQASLMTSPSAVPLDYSLAVVADGDDILLVGEPVLGAAESTGQAFDELAADIIQEQRRMAGQMGQLRHAAVTDALTGIANRRALTEGLDRVLQTAGLEGGELSVVMIDLDNFKQVNDRFGHAVGDRVLEATAMALVSAARRGDLVTRYGGEEFVVVLPECLAEEAAQWAERARLLVRQGVDPEIGRPVTASFGTATWMPGETATELLSRADAAMYEAKAAGRDRVVRSGSGPAGRR